MGDKAGLNELNSFQSLAPVILRVAKHISQILRFLLQLLGCLDCLVGLLVGQINGLVRSKVGLNYCI
jgi:hypothetical protein